MDILAQKLLMAEAPTFDHPELFEPRRIRLADINGTGTIDILYIGKDNINYWHNQSGNSWIQGQEITSFPKIDNLSQVQVMDLLGKGTACLVWSSPLPNEGYSPLRYIDLMAGTLLDEGVEAGQRINCNPYLLTEIRNNMGAITRMRYEPSTKFYLEDKKQGTPWITKLSFPVQVLCRVETIDDISKNVFVSRYAYHHGYFDGVEREFRGFGMVEQWDTEDFSLIDRDDHFQPLGSNWSEETDIPPVHTKTWFHTGFYRKRNAISDQYRSEYFEGDEQAWFLPDTILPENLTLKEAREAARALKGSPLRQEVFAQNPLTLAEEIYTATENTYNIQLLQTKGENKHGVFLVIPSQTLTYQYERNPEDPRIAHQLNLDIDEYGNITKSVAIAYPRRNVEERLNEQNELHIVYSENEFINRDEDEFRRIGVGWMQKTFEVGLTQAVLESYINNESFARPFFPNEFYIENEDVISGILNSADIIPYHELLSPDTKHQKRLLNCALLSFYNEDLTEEMPFGTLSAHALPYKAYQVVYNQAMLDAPDNWFNGKVDADLLVHSDTGFLSIDDFDFMGTPNLSGLANSFWSQSARIEFNQSQFFLPIRQISPFDHGTYFNYDDYGLLPDRSYFTINDTILINRVTNNYRLLQPQLIVDPNSNTSEVIFDTLGMVVGTAIYDELGNGDSLIGFNPNLSETNFSELYTDRDISDDHARAILGSATSRLVYKLDKYYLTRQPNFVHTITRERHISDPGGDTPRLQHALSYSDGFGREILTKVQAEQGEAPQYNFHSDGTREVVPNTSDNAPEMWDTSLINNLRRWVGNGRTIFNNKGLPVHQYEPFFDSHPFFTEEDLLRLAGVSPELQYDPLGRNIRTNFPDGTHSRVEFTPWMQLTYDQIDTLDDTNDWHLQRINGSIREEFEIERYYGTVPSTITQQVTATQRAATQALTLAETPTRTYLDSLGRPFLTIVHNKFNYSNGDNGEVFIPTRMVFNIIGNPMEIYDGRNSAGRTLEQVINGLQSVPDLLGNQVVNYRYAMNGVQIFQHSMDAGDRWNLVNVANNPIRLWDGMGRTHWTQYDVLQRPTHQWVIDTDGRDVLVERMIYGEGAPSAATNKLFGQLYLHFDGAGMVRNEAFDFKGNLLESSRRLFQNDYHNLRNTNPNWWEVIPNWRDALEEAEPINAEQNAISLLERDTFTVSTRYDALNRPYRAENHYDHSVQYPLYNEAGSLDRLRVNLHGATTVSDESEEGIQSDALPISTFIENINYNEKGQRKRIRYGNGVTTSYTYDKKTFRLMRMLSSRDNGSNFLQDLNYTYDPAGNITDIRNNAIEPVYFRNQRVDAHSTYSYDAISQLTEATGRENYTLHGQTSHREISETVVPQFPITNQVLRNYTQIYRYDPAGNIMEMNHRAIDGNWTREYRYAIDSNRLLATSPPYIDTIEQYTYNAHGSMTSMPHLEHMGWDYKDQLVHVNIRGNGEAFYTYDSQRQRVRKVIFNGGGRRERIYLGGFEIYRETGVDGSNLSNELQTLHIMDDQQRVCMVETPSQSSPRFRYLLSNHLSSSMVELDEQAQVITYEEYHPYGSTSFRVRRDSTEVSIKRYRYTGMERDEETGLNYHGARYYGVWLGRWISADPIGIQDGLNIYTYAKNNPINQIDTNGKQSLSPLEDFRNYSGVEPTEYSSVDEFISAAEGPWSQEYLKSVYGQAWTVSDVYVIPTEEVNWRTPEDSGDYASLEELEVRAQRRDTMGLSLMGAILLAPFVGGTLYGTGLAWGGVAVGSGGAKTAMRLTALSAYETDAFISQVKGIDGVPNRTKFNYLLQKGVETLGADPMTAAQYANYGELGLNAGLFLGFSALQLRADLRAGTNSNLGRNVVVSMEPQDSVASGAANALARNRNLPVIPIENLPEASSGGRLVFVGHGNPGNAGGLTSRELSGVVRNSGVRPSSIELVTCNTGLCSYPSQLASQTGATVKAARGFVYPGLEFRVSVGGQLHEGGVLLPSGQGWGVHLPVSPKK